MCPDKKGDIQLLPNAGIYINVPQTTGDVNLAFGNHMDGKKSFSQGCS